MGFLNPLFLVAAAAVAVPIVLHLFHRQRTQRVAFPALRYLQRTERDHARTIRLRQLLLLLLRSAIVLLLVAAGARLFLERGGGDHEPTALAIVLDNSMSSGRVAGEERILDGLRRLAAASIAEAGPEDRIWVIRAGEPWDVAVPGGADEARRRVADTEVSAARGDLSLALERARGLVAAAGLAASEVHLLSDLQATAFPAGDGTGAGNDDVPVVVWVPGEEPPLNHFIAAVEVGGGLPPLANQRTEISVDLGADPPGDTTVLPVRLVIGDRIRAAGTAVSGGTVVLPLGPFPRGSVHGWVETDADALREDDRRYFSFAVRPPVPVSHLGPRSFFLEQALEVLEEGGRVRRTDATRAEVLFAVAGVGLETRRPAQTVVVVPPEDAALLPALNRRLASAGVPWRYGPPDEAGETPLGESRLPLDLEGVRVLRHYPLTRAGAVPEGAVPLRLANGQPFLVEGRTSVGPYLLLAAPPEPGWTTLPVSAAMVPFLGWASSRSIGSRPSRSVLAGEAISTSAGVTHLETPGGTRFEVDGTRTFARTRESGIHTLLWGDSAVERVAVVPSPAESRLETLDEGTLDRMVGRASTRVSDPADWSRRIFIDRQGPELWRPLLLLALVLLLVEAWAAAAGATGAPGSAGAAEARRATVPAPGGGSPPSPQTREASDARAPVP